MACETFFMDIT